MLPSISILIVDDEEELAVLYRELIINMGLDATSFTRPLLALEHLKQYPDRYSIIMTDLRMPGMSGMELANKIRETDSKIKIFLITAFDIADLVNEPDYQSAKFNKILQKPIKLSTLRKIIVEQNFQISS